MCCVGGHAHHDVQMRQPDGMMNRNPKSTLAHGDEMDQGCGMHETGKRSLFTFLIGMVIFIAGVSLIGLIVQG